MRTRTWLFSGMAALSLAAAAQNAPVDTVLETLRMLEGQPARQEAFQEELAAEAARLKAELDAAQAELERLNAAAGAQSAARADAEARLAAIEKAKAALAGLNALETVPAISAEAEEHFEKTIRPILLKRCIECHGAEKQKGSLRLDSRAAMLAGGDSGPAIVAGDPAASLLVKALAYIDEPRMPPAGKLPQAEIDALTAWIQSGAPWPAHDAATQTRAAGGTIDIERGRAWWAYKPVQPQSPPPVRDAAWPQSPVDHFLLARMEAEGLAPAPAAEKRTLIRRATFDITGLPPAPEEVDAFLADDAPGAFARVVERLLASPQYGERWARHWLDVVRYTDSFDSRGGPATDPVEIHKYRDWVVRAFNDDMPYDRFVRYQIAGDVLAEQGGGFDPEGIIATGALAIGNWPQGDADKQKMITDIVDDQIDLVSRGFMATTMSCARCHDHKFDPFTMRDYYGMAGMFFSSHILPGPGQKTEGSPILFVPLIPKAEAAAIEQRKARIAELEKQTADTLKARREAFARAQLGAAARYLMGAHDFAALPAPRDVAAFAAAQGLDPELLNNWLAYLGLADFKLMTRVSRSIGGLTGLDALGAAGDTPSFTVNASGSPLNFLNIKFAARSVSVHPGPASPVAVAWKSPISGAVEITASIADIDASCGDGVAWRIERKGAVREVLASGNTDNGGKSGLSDAPPVAVSAGDYLLLQVLPKDAHICDSTQVTFTITEMDGAKRRWDLTEDALRTPLDEKSNPLPDAHGNLGVWHLIDAAEHAVPAPDTPLGQWHAARAGERAALEAAAAAFAQALEAEAAATPPGPLAAEFLSEKGPLFVQRPPFTPEAGQTGDPLAAMLAELDALRAVPAPVIPMANGIQEGGTPNTEHAGFADARIHVRGEYTRLGDMVPRGMPAVLLQGKSPVISQGSGRLELANFVASPENPLTARVMVNRIWQHHFGEGLVRTPGNFGVKGEQPTHPELLDFLADEFVRSGWSMKHMHRLMLLSAAYAQSSVPTPEKLERDPENRLLARMNRVRLEAEALRDAMLAVAGRLELKLGGEAYREIDVPRRTLYFRTVRSDRTTYNMLFDAADPAAIIDKRSNATVAPQALFLMNNPFVRTQAEALAKRITPGAGLADAVAQLYPLLFARPPRAEEIEVAAALLTQLGEEGQAPEDAWATYCHTLLATNEFAYID